MDENLGPVAISLRRERLERPQAQTDSNSNSSPTHMFRYRLVIRTSEVRILMSLHVGISYIVWSY